MRQGINGKKKTPSLAGRAGAATTLQYEDIVTETSASFHPMRIEAENLIGAVTLGTLDSEAVLNIPVAAWPVGGPRETRDALMDLAEAGQRPDHVSAWQALRKRGELMEPAAYVAHITSCLSDDIQADLERFRAYAYADAKERRVLELTYCSFTGNARRKRAQSLFGGLISRRVDARLAAELTHAWNRRHCEPPLNEDELASAINVIAARELAAS